MSCLRLLLSFLCLVLLPGCGLLGPDIPDEPPPLLDMEEPVELLEEPDDESLRQELPAGGFTGLYVQELGGSLDELEEAGGLKVTRVVENSPGAAAGLEEGDILLAVRVGEAPGSTELSWPSQWRDLELAAVAGDVFQVTYERAAVERTTAIRITPRLQPAARAAAPRFREEQKVGIVLRAATEVEAREAGLAPGAGAVIVGMARGSPWRVAGVRFQDLILEIDSRPVEHPQVVLDAIREAKPDHLMPLVVRRAGQRLDLEASVTRRQSELTSFTIPILFSHEKERDASSTSFLLGFLGWKSTAAAWEFKILWFIRFTGGDADQLEETLQ